MPLAERLSPGAIKLLQEKQIANFATVMADGSPQVTPVWIDVEPDGGHVLVNTAEGRIKTRNSARDPRVALTVVDSQNPYRTVVVRGTIVERRGPDEGANEQINRMAKKYLDKDVYPFRSGEQRVILRIKPHHVLERGVE
jgi:PPOX class probable F420-dependent enzyme